MSKGKTVIRIEDEIKHAQNYMNIQKIRYKNSFEVDFQIDEDVLDPRTIFMLKKQVGYYFQL